MYNIGDRVIYPGDRRGIIIDGPINSDGYFYRIVPIDGNGLAPLVPIHNIELDKEYYRDLKINQIIDGV